MPKKERQSELKADSATGKMKVRLGFEEEKKKPPSKLSFAAQKAPGAMIQGPIHREIRESEDDNVGLEATHQLEEVAEGAGEFLQERHRAQQLKQYRNSTKTDHQPQKANAQYLRNTEAENASSNPASKWQQKKAIKRQYAAAKSGKSAETARTTAEKAGEAVRKARDAAEKTAEWVWKHKTGIAVIAGILLMLAFMLNAMSSCSVYVESIGGAVIQSSYHASDAAIRDAEGAYTAMEQELQRKLDNYENTHSYDEYHYDLDDIEHDPYVLISTLSALHPGEWTLADVRGSLGMLFEKQYILTETVTAEIRYRTETRTGVRHARDPETGDYLYNQYGYPIMEEYEYEVEIPYTYYICHVKLENFDLSHVPVYVMNEDQLSMYSIYIATLGNRPDLFPGSAYIPKRQNGYTAYQIPAEALEDEVFAVMIQEAEKYLGYPYVWGGSKPRTSFDCSGFVSWVINHSRWDVGRLSAQGLCNICTPVSGDNVRPGDLVFFKGTYDTPGVSHVGIYVGNDMMLHCGDPISYTNLNSNYWQTHFYAYGRLP